MFQKGKVHFQLVKAVSLGSKKHQLDQFENVEEGLARGVFDLGEAKADHEDVHFTDVRVGFKHFHELVCQKLLTLFDVTSSI